MLTRGPLLGLNHVLAQHAWARQLLMPHVGCTVQFQLPPLPDLSLCITEAGLVEAAAADAVPNLLINIKPAAVPLILLHHPAMLNDIDITGSPELVQVIRQLFNELEWDFEDDLSKVFGDLAAHRLAGAGRAFFAWQREAGFRLARNFAEYWTEEQPLIARRDDLARFSDEVGRLHDDLERLDKRLEHLQQRQAR
jgi:ubiquinone biosynthesis protein UbiJ